MALKAPGWPIFLLSIVLALVLLLTRFGAIGVPFLGDDTTQFYGMLVTYVLLLLGCIMRGL